MKKMSKSIISILLSVVMIAVICIPAFATESKTAFIVVSGMNTFPLINENGEQAFPPSSDTITDMVLKVVPPVLAFLATNDYEALGDGIFPPLYDAFGPLAFDENGDSIENIDGTLFDCSLVGHEEHFINGESNEFGTVRAGIEEFGLENTFFFNYDWRKDPLVHADRLNEFIQMVKEQGDYEHPGARDPAAPVRPQDRRFLRTDCRRTAAAGRHPGGLVRNPLYYYEYG